MLKTRFTFYKNTRLTDSNTYIIDDIETFLNLHQKIEDEFVPRSGNVFLDSLNTEVLVPVVSKDFENFKTVNYVKIAIISHEENTEEVLSVAYYFVNYITLKSADTIAMHLTLDTLNTFRNKLVFSENTLVRQEHQDRFDYNCFYKKLALPSNKIYIKRKIPILGFRENEKKMLHECYFSPNNTESDVFNIRNYWVKMLIKTDYMDIPTGFVAGVGIYFIPFGNFNITVNNETVKGFFNYTSEEKEIFFSHPNVVSISLIPFGPCQALSDIEEGGTYQISSPLQVKSVSLYWDKNDPKHRTITGINANISDIIDIKSRNVGLQSSENPSLISLDKIYDDSRDGEIYGFNKFLFDILIFNDTETRFNELKNTVCENGFFVKYDPDQYKSLDAFCNYNEVALFSKSFLELSLGINFKKIFVNLENIDFTLQNTTPPKTFKDYIDGLNDSFLLNEDSKIIDLRFEQHLTYSDGFALHFKNTKYWDNLNEFKNYSVDMNLNLPLCNSDYQDFIQNGNSFRKLVEEQEFENKDVTQNFSENIEKEGFAKGLLKTTVSFGKGFFKKAGGFLSDIGLNPAKTGGLAYGAVQTVFGNPVQKMRGISRIANTFSDNDEKMSRENLVSSSKASIETILANKTSLNLSLGIRFPKRSRVELEKEFYLYGYEVNSIKAPQHNNRKFFDFLRCNPKFIELSLGNNDFVIDLVKKFQNGVYYIHKTNHENKYYFPDDNVENIENALLELL